MPAPDLRPARPRWRRRLLAGACLVPAGVALLASPAGAQDATAESVQVNLDNVYILLCAVLVIFMQAIFSGFQDWSAQKVVSSILTLIPDQAFVWRDGEKVSVPSSQLVVGDIVELGLGQKVPADMRIIKASQDLRFDKSILTGE